MEKPGKTVAFTPGPWEVEEEIFDHDWAISAPRWGALARVVAEMDDDGSGKKFTKSEAGWANAHLIAAAPEMYEALKAVQACFDRCGSWPPSITRIISAALAHAEGKDVRP